MVDLASVKCLAFGSGSCSSLGQYFFQPPPSNSDPIQGLGRKQTTMCFEKWRQSGSRVGGPHLALLLLGSPYQGSLGQSNLLGMLVF